MMLTFVQKNEVNRSSHSGDISCKRINQFDSQTELRGQNSTIKLLETTDSICCFYGCLSICKKSASYLNLVLTYCRFNIGNYFWHSHVGSTSTI